MFKYLISLPQACLNLPQVIIQLCIATKLDDGAEISILQRSGINWKWPKVKDQLFYEKDDIKMKLMPQIEVC